MASLNMSSRRGLYLLYSWQQLWMTFFKNNLKLWMYLLLLVMKYSLPITLMKLLNDLKLLIICLSPFYALPVEEIWLSAADDVPDYGWRICSKISSISSFWIKLQKICRQYMLKSLFKINSYSCGSPSLSANWLTLLKYAYLLLNSSILTSLSFRCM